jgi:hypothetical protein
MSSASMTLRPAHRATTDTYAGVAARQLAAARMTTVVVAVLAALQIAAIWNVIS